MAAPAPLTAVTAQPLPVLIPLRDRLILQYRATINVADRLRVVKHFVAPWHGLVEIYLMYRLAGWGVQRCTGFQYDAKTHALQTFQPYHRLQSTQELIIAKVMPSDSCVTFWLEQAAIALMRCHKAGFVHCDIKPDNFLVADDGCLLLNDWELAHIAGVTATNEIYSPWYRPPEAGKDKPVLAASDIWALGATVYHWRCGSHLMDPENKDALTKLADCPLDKLMRQMLDANPAKRPSAEQVLKIIGITWVDANKPWSVPDKFKDVDRWLTDVIARKVTDVDNLPDLIWDYLKSLDPA